MDINQFVEGLKVKYNYSEEMFQFLQKAVPALITYYGEDKKNIIFGALSECEIHIQQENEEPKEYLNQYFETDKEWDIPFLGGAFQGTQLSVKDNHVQSKSIIYVKTTYMRRYTPFNFSDDEKLSGLIHEMCHAIKGYGKVKVENGQVLTQTGLSKDYFTYDPNTQTFIDTGSTNTGFEEALNSYDEAEVMTIMTGIPHEFGAYKGMTQVARVLMQHKELASVIKQSQFSGNDEWIEFLGKENCEYIVQNFEDWISVLYSSLPELLNNREALMNKMNTAMDNVANFARNYTISRELQDFEQSRLTADRKIIAFIQQYIQYNNQTNSFEAIEEQGRSL